MRVREMEYKLYKESTTLQTAYITTENYENQKHYKKDKMIFIKNGNFIID